MKKWGPLRKLDMAIIDTIEKHHCRGYCGLIITCDSYYSGCRAHHDELYRKYLTELGLINQAQIIAKEFRWDEWL